MGFYAGACTSDNGKKASPDCRHYFWCVHDLWTQQPCADGTFFSEVNPCDAKELIAPSDCVVMAIIGPVLEKTNKLNSTQKSK